MDPNLFWLKILYESLEMDALETETNFNWISSKVWTVFLKLQERNLNFFIYSLTDDKGLR